MQIKLADIRDIRGAGRPYPALLRHLGVQFSDGHTISVGDMIAAIGLDDTLDALPNSEAYREFRAAVAIQVVPFYEAHQNGDGRLRLLVEQMRDSRSAWHKMHQMQIMSLRSQLRMEHSGMDRGPAFLAIESAGASGIWETVHRAAQALAWVQSGGAPHFDMVTREKEAFAPLLVDIYSMAGGAG